MKSRIAFLVIVLVFAPGCLDMCIDAQQTAYDEFRPRASLRKYEWFKNAASQLDALNASIQLYDQRLQTLEIAYDGEPRSKWKRADAEQYNVWASEVAGVKAGYNGLAAEYNAQMAKFNWAYANAGQVPAGSEALPREYRVYLTQ